MEANTFFLIFGIMWVSLFCVILPIVFAFSKEKPDYSKAVKPKQIFPWWNM